MPVVVVEGDPVLSLSGSMKQPGIQSLEYGRSHVCCFSVALKEDLPYSLDAVSSVFFFKVFFCTLVSLQ